MPRIETAERPGAARTEDRVLVLPDAVVLVDGATTLIPTPYDGGWYADQLVAQLRERLTANADLAQALADAIEAVAREFDLRPGNSPSSTVAIARWNQEQVDALVLADSPVVAFTASGVHVLDDDRLARVPRTAPYGTSLRAGEGFGAAHRERLLASARDMSRWRNRDGGFWVAEAEPAAAFRALRAGWPRAEVHALVLASDGVSCGIDRYGAFSGWPDLLAVATEHGARAVLDRVRAAEESDPTGQRWPRPKPHDDQSLAIIRFD
ncbi:hypothetical protein GCM10012275_44760 [Longimycelium tulufanense]|uniref:Protein phosphatase 2C-like protein n=1 Tax=Longimycelium tulufanense TaxID=907463 RepID=A0A8J3CHX0_9PSEU|nr:hypothetical protein [Longimycelium tulufanense]GGM69359.1 hypothetical protein GCM10012275_44760 [Longimycelium tulufanense]